MFRTIIWMPCTRHQKTLPKKPNWPWPPNCLFEMKRLSSGMAAQLIGMDRMTFLAQLQRFGVPIIDLNDDELAMDIGNA